MKKLISLILILLSALGLSGCARDRCAIPNRLDLLLLRKNPLPAYDSQASGRMFSHMGGSRALVQGTFLYTIELDGEHRPVLARYSLENAQLSQPVTLVELCAPQWICADGPFIFYVNALQDRRLERLNTETLETCVLVDEPCSYLQIKDNLLYYRGENNFLYSCDMDGQRRNTVLDKACCYPWFLGDALLYQSESEGIGSACADASFYSQFNGKTEIALLWCGRKPGAGPDRRGGLRPGAHRRQALLHSGDAGAQHGHKRHGPCHTGLAPCIRRGGIHS